MTLMFKCVVLISYYGPPKHKYAVPTYYCVENMPEFSLFIINIRSN